MIAGSWSDRRMRELSPVAASFAANALALYECCVPLEGRASASNQLSWLCRMAKIGVALASSFLSEHK